MSKIQRLRAFVSQRLSAAAEEIFELYEGTIAEYEEELCRQRELLDAVLRPEGRSHTAGLFTFFGYSRCETAVQEEFKGIVHPKMKIQPLSTHPHAYFRSGSAF